MSTRHHNTSQLIQDQTILEERQRRSHRRRIDLLNNQLDFHAAMLAGFGFSAKYIAQKTGFSGGQIYYRLRRAHIRIADYRNGVGVVAERMFRAHRTECEPALRRQIAAALKAYK